MAKKPKRDGAYYLGRLEREHPAAFSDYRAGKFASINEALFSVGLKKPRTRLDEMKNAWEKASSAERNDFIAWLRNWRRSAAAASAPIPAPATAPAAASPPIASGAVAVHRYLQPWAEARIRHIMSVRNLGSGEVMDELGFKRLDPSLGTALHRATRLQPSMISAIERWLLANASI